MINELFTQLGNGGSQFVTFLKSLIETFSNSFGHLPKVAAAVRLPM